MNAFKDRLRKDEEEITRLGPLARAALLNLGRDATPGEVSRAIVEIKNKQPHGEESALRRGNVRRIFES